MCQAFEDRGVRYVLVGAFAINLYAGRIGVLVATADCDVRPPADLGSLAPALEVLRARGFELEAGTEPLGSRPRDARGDPARACVRASRADVLFDLPLEISGARFEELWIRQRRYSLDGVAIRLAPLDALVRSKHLADRPKDRAFLEAHREVLERLLRAEEEPPR